MPVAFRDFAPSQTRSVGLFQPGEYAPLSSALAEMNAWLDGANVSVIIIETVVLPNIHAPVEEGTKDAALHIPPKQITSWHQFFRVWYRE